MHRNTLFLTVILAVIAALVVGVNIGRHDNKPQAIPTPSLTPTATPIKHLTFSSALCGITLEYPSNLQPLESTASGTAFVDNAHPDQSVILVCRPDLPKITVTADKIENITIQNSASSGATLSAKLYHDVSANNEPVDKLMFHNEKKGLDVYLGGFGATFKEIIASIKLF